ncbi:MAG: flagellar biosynthetic protein FliQ [Micrococcales bacterium]|nr:flagellar biosynthetic protein FliQ [Micrococcales bacterium]
MTAAAGLDWFRQMLWTAVIVGGPPVAAGLVVGLVVAVLQAATQVNDSAVSYAPKALATVSALAVAGSWMLARVAEFASEALTAMSRIHP